jgi:hypothetical protein
MSRRIILDTAQALRDCRPPLNGQSLSNPSRHMWRTCVAAVARAFGHSNRTFDRDRFYADCGWPPSVERMGASGTGILRTEPYVLSGNFSEMEARAAAWLAGEGLPSPAEVRADARVEARMEDDDGDPIQWDNSSDE